MKHTQGKVEVWAKINVVTKAGKHSLMGNNAMPMAQQEANADRHVALWNAADGMTNEEAVRYLAHGKEMKDMLKVVLQLLFRDTACPGAHDKIWQLIAKMEGK